MIQSLPTAYDNEIKFDCLTGLRPAEAVVSVQLINDKDSRYTTNLKVSLWSTSVSPKYSLGKERFTSHLWIQRFWSSLKVADTISYNPFRLTVLKALN